MATKKDDKTPKTDDPATDDKTPKNDDAATDPPAAKTYTQAELDAERKKWQKESDKKIADAQAKAKLSEDERKDAELAETKAALRERDARDAVKDAAVKAGVKNPDLFYKAVKSDLEFDDAGNVKNLKDVLESSRTEMPELYAGAAAAKPTPEGGADAGEGKNPPATLTKEAIEKMSEAEIASNMDAIDAFFASNAG